MCTCTPLLPLRYNVEYPALYADEKNCSDERSRLAFNCAQRAHQNSLENQPIYLALLTLSGLQVGARNSSMQHAMRQSK